LEAELTKAYDLMREQAEQAEAERSRLQEQTVEVARERDRLREALDQVSRERDRLSAEDQQRAADLTSVLEQAGRAESVAEEATGRIRELEDADRRAEAARVALKELREESEREREQSSRVERKLREDLAVAHERNGALERHLDGLTAAASEAQAMAEELMAVNRAIAGDDIPGESEEPPPQRPAKPQPPATSNGASGGTDHLGADVRKPTI
jgi:chromosome segregation ATPase